MLRRNCSTARRTPRRFEGLAQDLGITSQLASCLLLAAVCLSVAGDHEHAIELHGAADGLDDTTGRCGNWSKPGLAWKTTPGCVPRRQVTRWSRPKEWVGAETPCNLPERYEEKHLRREVVVLRATRK